MTIHPLAGQPAPQSILTDIPSLLEDYHKLHPNAAGENVSFGTSGHRGSSSKKTFNEDHILAISQALCEYRVQAGITGPLFIGYDTHALSRPAFETALEVLVANEVQVITDLPDAFTPTPVISHAILCENRSASQLADGIVITPSHNPPQDGGFKYNPPNGGPASGDITSQIQNRANELLQNGLNSIKRMAFKQALEKVQSRDLMRSYIQDLENVIDLQVIAESGLKIGVDPLGGAAVNYWDPIAEAYGLNIKVVNRSTDADFRFMHVDKDGKIRMDCSSPYAMAGLIALKDDFDIAFGNDPDTDRHGIVCPSAGLLNPNHYLSVAIQYLFEHRKQWPQAAQIGKTLVSSAMIDRVAAKMGRKVCEVPVGFKWFVDGLVDGSFGFGGEESAGASFLRKDGTVWTTDKDGIILNLLAAEITAKTGRDPGLHYQDCVDQFGEPFYQRLDTPATAAEKGALKSLSPEDVRSNTLAGEPITQILTRAPGNDAPIGGLKVVTENGWFAARPSGTEAINKLYAESFKGETHLKQIQEEAQAMIASIVPS